MEAEVTFIDIQPDVLLLQDMAAQHLSLFSSAIRAGFPSPAADYHAEPIDLNAYITQNPTSTFLARVEGDSMIGAHIEPGDLVVIDRSLKPVSGRIVLAFVAGEFTIKRLMLKPDGAYLEPENPNYESIRITQPDMGRIWGIVVGIVKKV
ncbi:translesion error-prone DNA polymerase V autoproteolytic subunit [Pontibacter sp. E15-1]|uniref:LexA family protein n=1 Tax=Pontibacter sp. E15-1 TaxID=2919918 RepID=UPI001F4FCB23|nr:translesion error-prone DNA polymerase V autoproteolytic subunit [Pontibacter sp. E15-1]MCJ8166667.1 translesion error-prone DNA polymerase V autoproteolytic subunit [Pontibacter sp. E15-1]